MSRRESTMNWVRIHAPIGLESILHQLLNTGDAPMVDATSEIGVALPELAIC